MNINAKSYFNIDKKNNVWNVNFKLFLVVQVPTKLAERSQETLWIDIIFLEAICIFTQNNQ